MIYDILIVGAGPAGLTAAVYARRAGKSVLLLDRAAFGGQITFSPKIENYPGFESLSGSELADKMVAQALAQGAEVEFENVISVTDEGSTKTVITEDGNEYICRALILATGATHRHLGLPNEERFIGEGISFCAVCDGAFYADRTVALVGGGNSALQEAILLCDTCKKVYVIQNLDALTGEEQLQIILRGKENVEIITGTVVSAIADTPAFSGITLQRISDGATRKLAVDGMFVAIGLEPQNEAFADLMDLDDRGYANADERCLTRTPGVFAAGDCRRKQVRQVATAISDGAVSAIAACRYLETI